MGGQYESEGKMGESMHETFAFPVVSLLILNAAGEVLLQERWKSGDPFHGYLELPQGRLKRSETLLECARRELEEETGLTEFQPLEVVENEVLEETSVQSLQGAIVSLVGRETYLAVSVVGSAKGEPHHSHEAQRHAWYTPSEVRQLLLAHRVFPLNVPMLRSFAASDS